MTGATIRIERSPGVLGVTLTRAGEQNTITAALLADLHRALDLAERAADCRVVTLAAEGGTFCAGMDLDAGSDPEAFRARASRDGAEFLSLLDRFTTMDRLVVSCVDGRVCGGGVGLVAASDLAYATPRSRFNLPEALWGLLPCCVLPFLVRRVGFQPAYAMTLTTAPVTAAEAERCRLVDRVVDEAPAALRRLVSRVARLDAGMLGEAKRYFRPWAGPPAGAAALRELDRLLGSDLVRARLAAFTADGAFPWETPGPATPPDRAGSTALY